MQKGKIPFQLTFEILQRSTSKTWEDAQYEWILEDVYMLEDDEEFETCLCGHYPIRELCFLRNTCNGNDATVGNQCVKRFLHLPSDDIFKGIRRISRDIDASLSIDAIEHAYEHHWINTWEKGFYLDIRAKHKNVLTARQCDKKKQINTLVLQKMKKKVESE